MRVSFPSCRTPRARHGLHHLAWVGLLAAPTIAQDEARAAQLIAEERALDPARVSDRVDTARRALAELVPDSTSEVARRVHLALGEADRKSVV